MQPHSLSPLNLPTSAFSANMEVDSNTGGNKHSSQESTSDPKPSEPNLGPVVRSQVYAPRGYVFKVNIFNSSSFALLKCNYRQAKSFFVTLLYGILHKPPSFLERWAVSLTMGMMGLETAAVTNNQ